MTPSGSGHGRAPAGVGPSLLEGKVALVSGVGPGLGRQIALKFSAAGAQVVLGARTESYVEEVAAEVVASGGEAAFARCDITKADDCRNLVALAEERFGGLDCLINNAFVLGPMDEPMAGADIERWRDVFDVNVFGTMQMVQASIGALRKRAESSIVFVSSQVIRRVRPGRGAYAASKAAAAAMAQVLARELGAEGIRVNVVVPGAMWGPPQDEHLKRESARTGTSAQDLYAIRAAPLAMNRIPSDAECAGAVVFLASELASAMTGQSIDVNGGEIFH